MIRPACRVTPIVALYLLTSAASVYAECAWVSWISNSPTGLNDPSPAILGSYESINGCTQALDSEERSWTKVYSATWPDVTLVPIFRTSKTRMVTPYSFKEKHDQKGYREFLCLPDTVDPRGPKGK